MAQIVDLPTEDQILEWIRRELSELSFNDWLYGGGVLAVVCLGVGLIVAARNNEAVRKFLTYLFLIGALALIYLALQAKNVI